jgi:hypothetical protein
MPFMRQLFLFTFIFLLFISCNEDKPKKLEDAFILSMQKNDFNVLKSFLPDKDFYNSLGDKMPKRTDEEIKRFLEESDEKIKQAWQNTIFNAAEKKIDLNKVMIKEVFYHDPFPNDETSEGMVVNYEYKGSVWDDIQFIVSRKTGKTILLSIPNPTRAFSMVDKELRATNEAKAWIEMSKPEFRKNIQELSSKLIAAAKSGNLNEFGQHLVYRGDVESRRWRTVLNLNDSTERKQAAELMQQVQRYMDGCDKYETGNFVTERESEGVWIVWPMNCGNKIVTLAYLRINGKLLLGDANAEVKH